MKVVLDTNIVISAIFFGGIPKTIVRAALAKRIELVATPQVLDEYREVARRLKVAYPTISYRRALAIIESLATMVKPATLSGSICRDRDDDVIIACALGGKAKIICSGDDDLLALDGYRSLEILTPARFSATYLK